MKAFKVIKDPDAFPIISDATRRRIIHLLRAKERTVSQIAEELELTPQAIYHHIRKLRDVGMVEVAREERVDHFIETYYRASAEVFHFTHGEGAAPAYQEAETREALRALARLGLEVEVDDKAAASVVALERRIDRIGEKGDWMDRVADLEDVPFMVKQELSHYAKLLTMTDDEFNEYIRLSKELRKALRATLAEAPKASG